MVVMVKVISMITVDSVMTSVVLFNVGIVLSVCRHIYLCKG